MRYAALLVTVAVLAVMCTLLAQNTDRAALDDDPMNVVFPSITVLGIRQADNGTYQMNLNEMWVNCSPALDAKDMDDNRIELTQLTPPLKAWARVRNDGEGRFTLNEFRVLEQGRYDENGDFILKPKRWRAGYEGRMGYEE